MRLSKTNVAGVQKQWARHGGDKFRVAWSYLMKLCKCSRWSNNLKSDYFGRFESLLTSPPMTERPRIQVRFRLRIRPWQHPPWSDESESQRDEVRSIGASLAVPIDYDNPLTLPQQSQLPMTEG